MQPRTYRIVLRDQRTPLKSNALQHFGLHTWDHRRVALVELVLGPELVDRAGELDLADLRRILIFKFGANVESQIFLTAREV